MRAHKKAGVIVNLDVGKVEYTQVEYEYMGMAPAVSKQEFSNRQATKKLGDLAGNKNRRRSIEAREVGWNSEIIARKDPSKGGEEDSERAHGDEQGESQKLSGQDLHFTARPHLLVSIL